MSAPRTIKPDEQAKALRFVLTSKDPKHAINPITTHEQTVGKVGGKTAVTVRKVEWPAGLKRPYKGNDEEALKGLEPSRWCQSDSDKVRHLAQGVVGDTTDAAEAARKIEVFVRKYIHKKTLSVGYATASEVVVSREGDCTEHAVLTAAMCKAVGIPARTVSGLAYAPRFNNRKDVFVPHAWAQVYLGGKWVSLDAALKGFTTAHITLSVGNGDPLDFMEQIATLGNLQIATAEAGDAE